MKTFSLPLGAGLAALVLLAGCTTMNRPLQPVAPVAPEVPVVAKPTAPDLPKVETGLGFSIESAPAQFPVKAGDMMVVSIPGTAIKTTGADSPSDQENEYRYSLIKAFLTAGYRVKDAGVVSVSSLTMRRLPGTDTEKSRTVETDQSSGNKVVRTESTQNASQDYWTWLANNGLTVGLNDPTSLWGPELLQYSKLSADSYFRVFRFSSGTASRVLPVTLGDEAYEAYRTQVAAYNARVAEVAATVADYDANRRIYDSAYDQYASEFQNWVTIQKEKGLTPVAKTSLPTLRTPEPAAEATPDEVKRARLAETTVLWLGILGEVVSAKSGEILWAGNIAAYGPASSNTVPRLLEKLVGKLVGRDEKP